MRRWDGFCTPEQRTTYTDPDRRWSYDLNRTAMKRLLYILPGLVPPEPDPRRDKFQHLSEICEGDILLPVWWSSVEDVGPHLKGTFPEYRVGRFTYNLFLFFKAPRFARKIVTFLWYIRRGRRLHQKNKIDVIVTYGTNLPAIAGLILKWLTGA